MKYDYKDNELHGFYEWNKKRFLIKKDDKRLKEFMQFKKQNGFFPDETWCLYSSICIFILPRLKAFRNKTIGTPGCFEKHEEWLEILDKMIWSFEQANNSDDVPEEFMKKYNNDFSKAYNAYCEQIQEGLHLFATYFNYLWW